MNRQEPAPPNRGPGTPPQRGSAAKRLTALRTSFLERGGLWVAAQGLLLLALAFCGLNWDHHWASPVSRLTGWLLLGMAAACGILGTIALGQSLTPFPQPSRRRRLVQRGIYRFMRHPLYTAVFCGSIGWALLRASWPALGAALVIAIFLDAKARREERWLRQQFSEYAEFERRVRRFVPWIY